LTLSFPPRDDEKRTGKRRRRARLGDGVLSSFPIRFEEAKTTRRGRRKEGRRREKDPRA